MIDLQFHARMLNGSPWWVTRAEASQSGSFNWEAKDRTGRLGDMYIRPNFRDVGLWEVTRLGNSKRAMTWRLALELHPLEDGLELFFDIRTRIPGPSKDGGGEGDPIISSSHGLASTEMFHAFLEGELNNVLRQLTNDITNRVIQPARKRRQGR